MTITNNQHHLGHTATTKYTWPSTTEDPKRFESSLRAGGSMTYKNDMFAAKPPAPPPWISENTHSLSSPQEWAGRIKSMTIVNTGSSTDMAVTTHHTVTRPKFPPGSIRFGNYTLAQYLPQDDAAVQELHEVVEVVRPHLEAIMDACGAYHLHHPDGWITSAGYITAARKAGLRLSRDEFLALERSVPKDTMGRINYFHVAAVISAVSDSNTTGDVTATAPEALGTGTMLRTRPLSAPWPMATTRDVPFAGTRNIPCPKGH